MDRARHWICILIFRGAGGGRMVYELGAHAGICAVCSLSNCARRWTIDSTRARCAVIEKMETDLILPDLQSAVLCEGVRCEINGMQTLVGVFRVNPAPA